jgi:hypothetical protein
MERANPIDADWQRQENLPVLPHQHSNVLPTMLLTDIPKLGLLWIAYTIWLNIRVREGIGGGLLGL